MCGDNGQTYSAKKSNHNAGAESKHWISRPAGAQGPLPSGIQPQDPTAPPEPRAPPPQAAARSQGQSAPVHFGRPQGASALGIPSSRKPDVEAKNTGDIGLNGSAKASNHSNTNTLHEVSGDIGLTKAAKESNHSLLIHKYHDQCVGPVDPSN